MTPRKVGGMTVYGNFYNIFCLAQVKELRRGLRERHDFLVRFTPAGQVSYLTMDSLDHCFSLVFFMSLYMT